MDLFLAPICLSLAKWSRKKWTWGTKILLANWSYAESFGPIIGPILHGILVPGQFFYGIMAPMHRAETWSSHGGASQPCEKSERDGRSV